MIRTHKEFVTVELGPSGLPIRIFHSRKLAHADPNTVTTEMRRGAAVRLIRKQVFERAAGLCELCRRNRITEDTGEMHEKKPRGLTKFERGEISVENSVASCQNCHRREHANRNPRWRKRG